LLAVYPSSRLASQDVESLTLRFAGWTAISGLEQAAADSLLALLPGSSRDRTGNVTISLGSGAPKRLATCQLDEPGFVVGNITDDGYLTLRRVGRVTTPLFDQRLEGHRVTLFGRRGPVPGVVAVRSTHLTRGRAQSDQVFTVDNAYVDVGAATRDEVLALGLDLLAPVALLKRPHNYGSGLLAAPFAARRAGCAALAAAVLARAPVRGTVVVAFTVQNGERGGPGLSTVNNLRGPFAETKPVTVASRFPETAVETIALTDVRAAYADLVAWLGGR
jgi:putative aminopeptidase FrvX